MLRNKRIDIIQLEINQQLKNAGTNVQELLNFIEYHGYTLYKFHVENDCLIPVPYTKDRENYFAISDIHKVVSRLQKV